MGFADQIEAAAALGVTRPAISHWASPKPSKGRRSVPLYIAKLCQSLERLRELEGGAKPHG
jgi:predicted XRE-type DNA-binding protein